MDSVSTAREHVGALHLFDIEPVYEQTALAAEELLETPLDEPAWIIGEAAPPRQWDQRGQDEPLAVHDLQHPLHGAALEHPLQPKVLRGRLTPAPDGASRPSPGTVLLAGDQILGSWKERKRLPRRIDYPTPLDSVLAALDTRDESGRPRITEHTLGKETRRALHLLAPSRLVYQAHVPPTGSLTFAHSSQGRSLRVDGGTLLAAPRRHPEASLQLLVEHPEGVFHPVWQGVVPEPAADSYEEVRVELAEFAGDEVRLHFRFTGEEDEGWTPSVRLAEPVLWGSSRPGQEATSVVLVVLDTLRASRLGCYGWDRAETPNLDRFASQGMLFRDATSAANWTLPAHASLFTSTYSSQHGLVRDERLADSLPTLAELLRARGFRTAAFAEGGYVNARHGFARGFETFQSGSREVDETLGLAAEWIAEQEGPYFAFVQTYKVHSPYDPEGAARERLVREYAGALGEVVHIKTERTREFSAEDRRYISDLYDAEIAELDAALGVFFEELARTSDPEQTLVILTSDHGEEFFEHGQIGHGTSAFQEQIGIPLLMQWGSHLPGGQVVEEPVHTVDIATTVLAATGTPAPALYQGANLLEALEDESRPVFSPMVTHWNSTGDRSSAAFVIREGSLKYLTYPLRGSEGEEPSTALFDLSYDPEERINLLDERSLREWEERSRALLEAFPLIEEVEGAAGSQALKRDLEALGYVDGE